MNKDFLYNILILCAIAFGVIYYLTVFGYGVYSLGSHGGIR